MESIWAAHEVGLLPEIGGEESVGLGESVEGGSGEVLYGLGLATGAGEHITDTSELEDLFGGGGTDDSSSTGSGDQTDGARSALSSDLAGHGMWLSNFVSPVASADGDEVALGDRDAASNGKLDFLGELDTDTNVAIVVTNGHHSLEAGPLAGLGLLLDTLDLHGVILELFVADLENLVNNLGLLDGKRVSVDKLEVVHLLELD